MPDYCRPRIPGATVYFTVALMDRGSRLLVERVGLLREAVKATRAERPFGVEAWVVLPDHLHCVWRLPEGDADYAVQWRLIKGRFSAALPAAERRSASKVAKGEKGIWQRRYWEHHIRDEADLTEHIRYCWINPVKHGLVERPEEWPFSPFYRDGRPPVGGWMQT
jgi:putative transposase